MHILPNLCRKDIFPCKELIWSYSNLKLEVKLLGNRYSSVLAFLVFSAQLTVFNESSVSLSCEIIIPVKIP